MKIAVAGGKKTRPDIKLGICGEHGIFIFKFIFVFKF